MPLLLYPLLAFGGIAVGSLINNATNNDVVITSPQEASANAISGYAKAAMYGVGAIVLFKLAKKYI